VKINL